MKLHPYIDGTIVSVSGFYLLKMRPVLIGRPCNSDGYDIPKDTPPPPKN